MNGSKPLYKYLLQVQHRSVLIGSWLQCPCGEPEREHQAGVNLPRHGFT
jgi:hypothetical protein